MTKENLIKEVIDLTLEQVLNQGWDLIDTYDGGQRNEAIKMVYDKIKEELS